MGSVQEEAHLSQAKRLHFNPDVLDQAEKAIT